AFPFDKIKRARPFMGEAETSPQAKAIIRAVLALGKSLDIPVLAEGIETQGQLSLLNAEGCDEAQGYLLGRPVPLSEIVESGQLHMTGFEASQPKQERKPVRVEKTAESQPEPQLDLALATA